MTHQSRRRKADRIKKMMTSIAVVNGFALYALVFWMSSELVRPSLRL
jgi:hypothetical protein